MQPRLAIITTHPIQYNAPLFRLLSERKRIAVKVFYTWGQSESAVYDARFGIERKWDIPLLDGYDYEFIRNSSRKPDSNRFFGIINPGLLQEIKKSDFDAVLIYRWSVWSHFYLMQNLGGRPLLFFRGDSTLLNKSGTALSFFKKILFRFVYRNVDAAFAVGVHNKTYLQACGLKLQEIIHAPHAVENERFVADATLMEQKALEERRLIGIADDTLVFQYAGKFYGLKQLDLLIKAFQKLKGTNYRLLLTGNGEDEFNLRSISSADNRIIFQSFKNQSEMPWVYRMGDVFVLPSKSETWGLSVNEAMACGRPAIVCDQCGCAPDLIVEGKNGFVFKTNSESDLLHCLQQFNSRSSAKEMESYVLMHIAHFSLENVAEAIEKTIIEKKKD